MFHENDGAYEECPKKKIIKLKERLPLLLKDPIIKEFLRSEENEKIFNEVINGQLDIKHLDNKFKEFYLFNRIIRYMTGLIKRYSIDYDKRVKLRNERYQLTYKCYSKNVQS